MQCLKKFSFSINFGIFSIRIINIIAAGSLCVNIYFGDRNISMCFKRLKLLAQCCFYLLSVLCPSYYKSSLEQFFLN